MQALQRVVDQGKRVFIFLGEAGSGKSEIAINWALMLADMGNPVRFFDMDQTKPIFRSRELAKLLKENGIIIDVSNQFLDAPSFSHAVFDPIREPNSYIILDIGGNVAGAKCIGQFAEAWGNAVMSYLVINSYRPFSANQRNMLQTTENIIMAARLENVSLISNPNFGEQTTLEEVIEGHRNLVDIIRGTPFRTELLVAPRRFGKAVQSTFPEIQVLGIERYVKAPWEEYESNHEGEIWNGENSN